MKAALLAFLKLHWKTVFNYLLARFNKKHGTKIEVTFGGDITKESDYDERDYTLDGTSALKELPFIERDTLYLIDQSKDYATRNSCVPTSIYLAICNNLNITPDYMEWLDILEEMDEQGLFDRDRGSSIPMVTKALCKYWNEELHPDRKVTYYRLNYADEGLAIAYRQGYQVVGGHNTFTMYTQDRNDKKIDFDTYKDWKRAGGHCVNSVLGNLLKKYEQTEVGHSADGVMIPHNAKVISDKIHVTNTYPTRQGDKNFYEHGRLGGQCKNGIWYSWFYVIAESDPKKVQPEIIQDGSPSELAINTLGMKRERMNDPITRFESFSVTGRLLQYVDKKIEEGLKSKSSSSKKKKKK